MTEQTVPLHAQHMDVRYSPEQDRLHVVLRNGEAAAPFWVTRRLTRALIRGLLDMLGHTSDMASRVTPDKRDEVLLFEHVEAVGRRGQAAARGGNAESTSPPAAPGPDAVVMEQIDLTVAEGNIRLSVVIRGHCVALLPLSRDNAHQLAGMLHDHARSAAWDLEEFVWMDRRVHMVVPDNVRMS